MGRSVSYPSGAVVAYTTLEPITDDGKTQKGELGLGFTSKEGWL